MDISNYLHQARIPLRYYALWRLAGWLLVALIVYGSLTPAPVHLHLPDGDKVQHFSAYTVLMLWFAQLYRRGVHWLLGLGCVALGILMEYAQLASGYRDFEYLDMVADAFGVLLGWLLAGTALAQVLPAVDRLIGTAGES